MRQTTDKATRTWRWGASASVAVHVLIVALLVFGLPLPEMTPDEPDAIAVELVPPPELAPEPELPPEPAPEPELPPEPPPPPEPEPAENAQAPETEPPQADATVLENEPERKVLDPVFEFGEQDAGPRLADDGSATQEEQAAVEEPEPAEQLPDGTVTVVPEPRPRVELTEVERLFSPAASDSIAAMTAMGDMPRDRRAGELCVTEMREQLRRADPPFWPDLLPAYRLVEGTLMEVHEAAFRAGGEWYDLAFRCEVDDRVTRVISFAFTVGDPIPRSEWGSRGLPAS